MPEKNILEDALGDLVDNLTDAVQKNKQDTVASRFNRLFGREKPIHHVLGGGRCKKFQNLSDWFCVLLFLI